jgi:hypothetical protein
VLRSSSGSSTKTHVICQNLLGRSDAKGQLPLLVGVPQAAEDEGVRRLDREHLEAVLPARPGGQHVADANALEVRMDLASAAVTLVVEQVDAVVARAVAAPSEGARARSPAGFGRW